MLCVEYDVNCYRIVCGCGKILVFKWLVVYEIIFEERMGFGGVWYWLVWEGSEWRGLV